MRPNPFRFGLLAVGGFGIAHFLLGAPANPANFAGALLGAAAGEAMFTWGIPWLVKAKG